MSLHNLLDILIMLFLVSVIGYIFSVLKEKKNLIDNIIVIDKKSITQEHIDATDIKFFSIGDIKLKSGDEVRIILSNKNKIAGIIIGAIKRSKEVLLVTHNDEIKKVGIDEIKRIKLISKYGKFF